MRFKQGVVVSTKMDKTVKILIERMKAHPKYKKRYKVSTKLYAHNENPDIKVGDKVLVVETKPMSKLKRWRVISKQEHDKLIEDRGTKQSAKVVINLKEYTIPYKTRKKKVKTKAKDLAPQSESKTAEKASPEVSTEEPKT